MGLGKTLQAIALIYVCTKQSFFKKIYLYIYIKIDFRSLSRPFLQKVIVVAPLTLIKTWMNEFKKWFFKKKIIKNFFFNLNFKFRIEAPKLSPLLASGSKETIESICKKFALGKYTYNFFF